MPEEEGEQRTVNDEPVAREPDEDGGGVLGIALLVGLGLVAWLRSQAQQRGRR